MEYCVLRLKNACIVTKVVWLFSFAGTRVRVEPEIQRGQVHHRAGAYDKGERVGLINFNRRPKLGSFWIYFQQNKTKKWAPALPKPPPRIILPTPGVLNSRFHSQVSPPTQLVTFLPQFCQMRVWQAWDKSMCFSRRFDVQKLPCFFYSKILCL